MLKPPANQSQKNDANRSALDSQRRNPTHVKHAERRDPTNNFDTIHGGDSYKRISALQKSAGNQAVLRMLSNSAPVLRTKLTVHQPGDHYEQEADRVADQVMRMTGTGEAPPASVSVPKLRRKCACGGSGDDSCSECGEKKKLQRSADQPHSIPQVPSIVRQVLSQLGQALDTPTRNFFEPRFNRDFSRARIHTNVQAAASARAVNARAYTVVPDIAFAAGQYQPNADSGRLRAADSKMCA